MSTAPVPVPDQGEHFTQSTEAPNSTQTHSLALCPCGRPVRHRGRCKGSKAAGGRTNRLNTVKAAIDKPEAPVTQTGNSLTLKLQCGAKLNITLDGNWFYLTENDLRVVEGILDCARQMGV